MPRPRKCRKVCCLPNNDGFVPVRGGEELTPIVLNVDEYESIRLIDREGFSQEQCGEYMRIARTTVQQIYAAARKKLADALVEGLPLRIEGGDFTLCNGNSAAYGCRNCYQQKIHPMHEKPKGDNIIKTENPAISILERSRCRSSQVITDSPTPFSALNCEENPRPYEAGSPEGSPVSSAAPCRPPVYSRWQGRPDYLGTLGAPRNTAHNHRFWPGLLRTPLWCDR